MKIKNRPVGQLVPYAKNARTHSAAQLKQLAALILEYGWTNPVLIDGDEIVAGHGRVLAAQQLYSAGKTLRTPGGEALPAGTVPTIDCAGWTPTQRRAYVIADNKSALNAGWDEELLQLELKELAVDGVDMELIGFTEGELAALLDGDADAPLRHYAQTVNTPAYVPKGDKPPIAELVDGTKRKALIEAIHAASEITEDERAFLLLAAARHNVFDYHQIAEYYCHASPAVQALMEDSALVIIDFNKAINGGFVALSQRLGEVFQRSYPNEQGGNDDHAQ